MNIKKTSILFALLVAGCAQIASLPAGPVSGAPTVHPKPRPPETVKDAVTAEQFDTTTPEQRSAAVSGASAGQSPIALGTTIAALGNPAVPGFWLETPLVKEVRMGRVVFSSSGKMVSVELRPIAGPSSAGSRISLPAMRLLGAPLTGLPELIVYSE